MKVALLLFAVAVILAESLAQRSGVDKGGQCFTSQECIQDGRFMKCVNNFCGCRKGQRQEEESRPGGQTSYVCSNVIGLGCNRHTDCAKDMDNSKCTSERCECRKEDGCIAPKNKGEQCQAHHECIDDARRMKCVDYYCGCKKGQRQQEQSQANGESSFLCIKVIGASCARDDDCNVDLDNATCNPSSQLCECKKDNGCNGASTMAIISVLPMVLLSIGLLKSW